MRSASVQGYAEEAGELVARYESLPFVEKHAAVLHLIPDSPCEVIDIGAGTGADAAWLAGKGHRVLAVEPTAELRQPGMALHPSPSIEWLDDALPDLEMTMKRGQKFDMVMLTAVWMHLDAQERERAMRNVAMLPALEGVLILSLRHGPVPAGRRMFEVTAQETIALARVHGLRAVLDARAETVNPLNRHAGVTWTCLAFRRAK